MKYLVLSIAAFLLLWNSSFLSAQNVGINTTNPQTALHVADDFNGGLTIGTGTASDGGNLRLLSNSIHWNLDNFFGGLRLFTETGYGTGRIERFRLNIDGTIGFNASNSGTVLNVRNFAAGIPKIFSILPYNGNDGDDIFMISENGNAGIRGTHPNVGLLVDNDDLPGIFF